MAEEQGGDKPQQSNDADTEELQARIAELETSAKACTKELADAVANAHTQGATVEQLTEDLKVANEEAVKVDGLVVSLQEQLDEAEAAATTGQTPVDQQQSSSAKLQAEIADLTAQLAQAE